MLGLTPGSGGAATSWTSGGLPSALASHCGLRPPWLATGPAIQLQVIPGTADGAQKDEFGDAACRKPKFEDRQLKASKYSPDGLDCGNMTETPTCQSSPCGIAAVDKAVYPSDTQSTRICLIIRPTAQAGCMPRGDSHAARPELTPPSQPCSTFLISHPRTALPKEWHISVQIKTTSGILRAALHQQAATVASAIVSCRCRY